MGVSISREEFDNILKELSLEYKLYGPKRFKNKGRFSDTDLIRYEHISSID